MFDVPSTRRIHGRRNLDRLLLPALLVVLLVAALHWTHPGYYIAQTDLNPPDHIYNQFLGCIMPWNFTQSYLGQPSWCFAWSPALLVHVTLAALFGGYVAESLILVIPYCAALLAMYYCARQFTGRIAACAAAAIYVFNPYVQVMIALNNAVPVFTALFALIGAIVARAALKPETRRSARLQLCIIFALGVALTAIMPHLLVDLVIGCVLWTLAVTILSPDAKAFWKWLLGLVPVLFLSSLWWLIPEVATIKGAENYRPTTVTENTWTFERASLLNLLRLNPVWLWGNHTYFPVAAAYDSNIVTFASSLLTSFGLAGALAVLRGKRLRFAAFLGVCALVILFFAKGPHQPLGDVTSYVMSLPILIVLQDPAGMIVIATFMLALCGGLFVERVGEIAPRFFLPATSVAVAGSLVSASFLLMGWLFHTETSAAPSMYVKIPDYWIALGNYLRATPGEGGVVFLPADDRYDPWYVWDFLGADTVPESVTTRRVLLPGPPFGYFVTPERTSLYASVVNMIDHRMPESAAALRDLGIRFVVVREDLTTFLPHVSAGELHNVFPRAAFHQFGSLGVIDLGTPRSLVVEERTYISESTSVDAGTLFNVAALTNDYRPRVVLPQRRYSTIETLAQNGFVGEYARMIVAAPSQQFTARIDRGAKAVVGVAPPTPVPDDSDTDPYLIAAYSAKGQVFDATPSVASTTVSDASARFDIYNAAEVPVGATATVRCRQCPDGGFVTLKTGTDVMREPAQLASDGERWATFSGIRWKPGFERVMVVPPSGGAVRERDLVFPRRSETLATRSNFVGLYPVHVRIIDYPTITDPYINHELVGAQSALLAFVSAPHERPIACAQRITTFATYPLYSFLVDCLQEHGLPVDTQSLASTTLTALAVDAARSRRATIRDNNRWSAMAVRWRPNGAVAIMPQLAHSGERESTGSISATFVPRLLAGDLLDAFLPAASPVSTARAGTQTLAFHGIDGGGMALGSRLDGVVHTVTIDGVKGLLRAKNAPGVTGWHDAGDLRVAVKGTVLTGSGAPASAIVIGSLAGAATHGTSCEASDYSAIVRCRVESPALLVQNEAFHWSWAAFTGLHVLPHVKVDGWRNGFVSEGGGDVTIVNLLDVGTAVLFVLTIIGLTYFSLRKPT